MKIQILISKNSWAEKYSNIILSKLKKFCKEIIILNDHKKLKKNFDLNIVFSYFKLISNKYLLKSQFNLLRVCDYKNYPASSILNKK
jgi:hypothetical protein|tara:strand:+ start:970 stop:1230 length:261 start_codon:yes stop_codon:yes gene_type:complete